MDSTEELKYAGVQYLMNNLLNPVYFYDRLKHLPSDTIVLELGPHSVFEYIVNQTLESTTYMSLLKQFQTILFGFVFVYYRKTL